MPPSGHVLGRPEKRALKRACALEGSALEGATHCTSYTIRPYSRVLNFAAAEKHVVSVETEGVLKVSTEIVCVDDA